MGFDRKVQIHQLILKSQYLKKRSKHAIQGTEEAITRFMNGILVHTNALPLSVILDSIHFEFQGNETTQKLLLENRTEKVPALSSKTSI